MPLLTSSLCQHCICPALITRIDLQSVSSVGVGCPFSQDLCVSAASALHVSHDKKLRTLGPLFVAPGIELKSVRRSAPRRRPRPSPRQNKKPKQKDRSQYSWRGCFLREPPQDNPRELSSDQTQEPLQELARKLPQGVRVSTKASTRTAIRSGISLLETFAWLPEGLRKDRVSMGAVRKFPEELVWLGSLTCRRSPRLIGTLAGEPCWGTLLALGSLA